MTKAATGRPSREDLRNLSERLRLGIDNFELDAFEELSNHLMEIIEGLDRSETQADLPSPNPPLSFRDAGRAPEADEDPLNAIVRWCHVHQRSGGQLDGRRVAVKDNIAVAGVPLTAGSRIFRDFVPRHDSSVVRRILSAGGEIVATTNMDALAYSAGGETSSHGPVLNPYDRHRTAGGSSGGSAASLHYDSVDVAVGGDQGGSIRVPASWCGIIGLKPTFSLVPHTGILGVDRTFNHVGPMGRSVEDVSTLLSVVAGPDGADPTQRNTQPDDYVAAVDAAPDDLVGVRVGVVREGFTEPVDPPVAAIVRDVIGTFRELGADIVELSVPEHLEGDAISFVCFVEGFWDSLSSGGNGYQHVGYYDVELSAALNAGLRSHAKDLPATAKMAALVGAFLRERHGGLLYARAQHGRRWLRRAYDAALAGVDILVMPTTPWVAHRAEPGAPLVEHVLRGWATASNTHTFDMTGHPAISLPAAALNGLPVGVQLIGRHFEDARLLSIGRVYEKAVGWKPEPGR